MAWNEPTNPNRDPWSAGRRGGGPPDLDEMLKRLRARFSGKRGGPFLGTGLGVIAAIGIGIWLASGFYVVDEQERAVIQRFGAISRTEGPGLHLRWPRPIEVEKKVNVTRVRSAPDKFDLLTQDENIVSVELTVHFRVSSPEEFLFKLDEPEETVRQVSRAAMLEVAGSNTMDAILSKGRQAIADQARQLVQQRLDAYQVGLLVAEVDLQQVQPPEQVRKDFDDAIKADQDRKRLVEDARAYADDRLPRARGAAARETAEAASYRERLIATAEGESSRFSQLLAEYRKAPKVTRERLYLDAMGDVLSRTNKVLIDVDKGGPMIYLPLEQLLRSSQNANGDSSAPATNATPSRPGGNTPEGRSRDRGAR
jgi:modulator of FtsH protease HflK